MAETLPLFPLSTVLLPGASLPLHVFEPRYRQLTVDLETGQRPGRCFGVVAIKQGQEVGSRAVESMYEVGCSAALREVRRLPDGRFDIVTRGEHRFRLLDVDAESAPYLVGTVEWLPDTDPPADLRTRLPLLSAAARYAHQQYCIAAWQRDNWEPPERNAELGALAHLLAADCLLPVDDRQSLLEERCPAGRLLLVRTLLQRETWFLRTLRAVPAPMSRYAVETSHN